MFYLGLGEFGGVLYLPTLFVPNSSFFNCIALRDFPLFRSLYAHGFPLKYVLLICCANSASMTSFDHTESSF